MCAGGGSDTSGVGCLSKNFGNFDAQGCFGGELDNVCVGSAMLAYRTENRFELQKMHRVKSIENNKKKNSTIFDIDVRADDLNNQVNSHIQVK